MDHGYNEQQIAGFKAGFDAQNPNEAGKIPTANLLNMLRGQGWNGMQLKIDSYLTSNGITGDEICFDGYLGLLKSVGF
jgi:Ca2+-binding EF-hand superfamily protein